MKIGIDLDGVTVNIMDQILAFYKYRTGKSISKEEIHTPHLDDLFGCSKEEKIKIVQEFYESKYFDASLPCPGAIETLSKLKKDNDLYVITSRWGIGKEKTPNWIEKNLKGLISNIFFTSEHYEGGLKKEEVCKKYLINLHLEDDPNVALKCAKLDIPIFLFDYSWNRGLSHKKITRVSSWPEVLEKLISNNT